MDKPYLKSFTRVKEKQMIYTFIPYSKNQDKPNLGEAYNSFMSLLPNDDDWACFIDHDAMFTTYNWFKQLTEIISKYPNAGCFTAMTNRVGNPYQVLNSQLEIIEQCEIGERRKKHLELLELNHSNHDIKYHRKIGEELYKNKNCVVSEIDSKHLLSGVLLLVNKKVWKEIPFREGFLDVDNFFHKDCIQKGYKVYLIEGVYVYHWYRGNGDSTHLKNLDRIKD